MGTSHRRMSRLLHVPYNDYVLDTTLPAAVEGSEPSEAIEGALCLNDTTKAPRIKLADGTWADIPTGASSGMSAEQRAFRSNLQPIAGAVTTTGNALFVYLGKVPSTYTPKFVEFAVSAGGSGAQTAEVGLFSTPLAPNKAGQSLTKLVATGTVSDLTGTGVMRNTAAFTTAVVGGTHLWAGIRTALATTQPAIYGLTGDLAQGGILTAVASGVLTGAGPFTGTIIAHALTWQAPNLTVTLD